MFKGEIQMSEVGLIDSQELLRRYPALKSKGKNPFYRLQWLTRSRAIPLVKIRRRIYFDPAEIDAWIESQKIPAEGEV